MEFTDQELMLIEQITYYNKAVADAAGVDIGELGDYKTVGDLFKKFDEDKIDNLIFAGTIYGSNGENSYMQGDEWAAIITDIQNNDKISSLSIYKVTTTNDDKDDTTMGEFTKIDTMVLCEQKPNKEYDYSQALVCFRGTLDAKEWYDNFQLFVTADTPCNIETLEWVEENLDCFESIVPIGHSKGANKAAYIYYMYAKAVYALAMDGQGFPLDFYDREQVIEKAKMGNLKAYALQNDFVNILLFAFLGTKTQYCKGYGLESFLENHSSNSFFKVSNSMWNGFGHFEHDKDGNIVMKYVDQSAKMKLAHGFTIYAATFMSDDLKEGMADYLGNAMAIFMGGSWEVDGVNYYKDPKGGQLGVVDYLATNPEMLTTLLAYLAVYIDVYGKGKDGENFLNFIKKVKKITGPVTNPVGTIADSIAEFFGFDGAGDYFTQTLARLVIGLDEETIKYVDTHIQDRYDEVRSLSGMGSYIGDPQLPIDYSFDPSILNMLNPAYDGTVPSGLTGGLPKGAYDLSNPLYMDGDAFLNNANNIYNVTDELKFNPEAFDMEDEICGTESLLTLTDYWHKTANVTERNRQFVTGDMYKAMLGIHTSVFTTSKNVADALETN